MDPQFRRAGPGDAGIVRSITDAAYARWIAVLGRAPLPMQADHAHAIAEHRVELAMDGDQPVALIEMTPEPDCLLVVSIAVLPDMQKRGLGDILLERAEQVARSLRLPAIRLYTNSRFETNVAWYMRRGFTIEGTEQLDFGTRVYFRKVLPVEIA